MKKDKHEANEFPCFAIDDTIGELDSEMLFSYKNKPCGVSPLSFTQYEMWYGDKKAVVKNTDEVFSLPFFDDESLKDIFDKIELI